MSDKVAEKAREHTRTSHINTPSPSAPSRLHAGPRFPRTYPTPRSMYVPVLPSQRFGRISSAVTLARKACLFVRPDEESGMKAQNERRAAQTLAAHRSGRSDGLTDAVPAHRIFLRPSEGGPDNTPPDSARRKTPPAQAQPRPTPNPWSVAEEQPKREPAGVSPGGLEARSF